MINPRLFGGLSLGRRFLPALAAGLFLLSAGCQAGAQSGAALPSPPAPAAPARVHPNFDLTRPEAENLVTGLAPELRAAILADLPGFLGDLSPLLDLPPIQLRLVDKQNALPADYVPEDLTSLNTTRLARSRNDLSLRGVMMPDMLALDAAARAEGLRLVFSSSYRSFEYQRGLFERYAARDGVAAAERYSARPGHSQHQLGTAVDFGDITEAFAATPEGRWLKVNAARFGLSLSYPEGLEALTGYQWEPWHYRWIGAEAAAVQARWFGDIQQTFLTWWDQQAQSLRDARGPVTAP